MKTTTELYRTGHTAHIYQDKMFVVGEKMEEWNERRDISCLDLSKNFPFVVFLKEIFIDTFIWSSFEDITIIKGTKKTSKEKNLYHDD